ncbi:superinfection immunity protein [Pseudomonas canadensis]|uniref:superinfection immunity protein n=1 Tax=Pseudomonas canadensis TaxID=915099 RepID=UPI001F368CA3|nr:superinfection immunity protein [Pseudomonas canadensis]MCF5170724.1 superinfection immunity protein [Pseudomonas canadensis]
MKTLGFFALLLICLGSFQIANIGGARNGFGILATIIFFPSAIALYFFPTICAFNEHPKTTPIFALNLLAGWTLIGWVAAFVWALSRPTPIEFARASGIPEAKYRAPPYPVKMRDCPYCAESVKAAAIKCRYCGSDFDRQPA